MIGTGGICRNQHLPNWVKQEDVEVVALCDASEDTVKSASQQFNVSTIYTDYKKMLQEIKPDVVDVCTPNFLHYQPVMDALNSGAHAMVEKPIAMNAKQAQDMVDAAKANKKKLMVAQNMRFGGAPQAIRKFIDSGDLGDLYYARVQAIRRRGIPSWGVFTQKDKQGGGPLIDIGVHMLDMTLWLLGHPKPVAATGNTYCKMGTRCDVATGSWGMWDNKNFTVEDFAVGLVRFDNGATLSLESSFAAHIEKDVMNVALVGTHGGCELSPLKLFTDTRGYMVDMTPVWLPNINTYEAEVRGFIDAIKNDTDPPVTGEQALMTTKILDAIYQSSEKGCEVPIS
jgi:predicted dehydrogenase